MERLKKIGTVQAVHSSQVGKSFSGIGFEKLDRRAFDPEKAYDKVAETGVKWVRIQSGWARTEKEKGVYDFAWLDSIVDNLRKRGLQVWMCLCYGNGLYDEKAAAVFGSVGYPPIYTEEQKRAWANYVSAVVKHYEGRVDWFEIWNEPDGVWCWKNGPSGTEYGLFALDTAKAIRQGSSSVKIIGGCLCLNGLQWLTDVLSTGAGEYFDAVTYHNYLTEEDQIFNRVTPIRALCRSYNPKIEIIQGETGTQSRSDGAGALRGGAWTQHRQAKFMARHFAADLINDVKFSSYFSCMDMIEALNGTVGDKASYMDFGYFGVLGADFDENGMPTGEYKPKESYRTLQTLSAIFREDFSKADLPVQLCYGAYSPRLLRNDDAAGILRQGFRRPSGAAAWLWWKPTDLMTTEYEGTFSLEYAALPEEVRLVDLLTGDIYELPESIRKPGTNGQVLLEHLPVRDYPLLLTFGNFIL